MGTQDLLLQPDQCTATTVLANQVWPLNRVVIALTPAKPDIITRIKNGFIWSRQPGSYFEVSWHLNSFVATANKPDGGKNEMIIVLCCCWLISFELKGLCW